MLAAMLSAASASAQVIGTFNWQMQPYCNTVTLTLTTAPTGFALNGVDDQCGADTRGSAVGTGVFNADGTIGLNFTIVSSPAGRGGEVAARVNPANGQGTWTDAVGNRGTFAFFGATAGLPRRPVPASGTAPGTVTALELAPAAVTAQKVAPAAIGAAQIDTTQVQARVSGACPAGQAMTRINADGSGTCAGPPTPTIAGSYAILFEASRALALGSTSISFNRTLPSAPAVHWLAPDDEPTAACPGTVEAPLAAPGHLCVYTSQMGNLIPGNVCVGNATGPIDCDVADRSGAAVMVKAVAAGETWIHGSWAVTPQ